MEDPSAAAAVPTGATLQQQNGQSVLVATAVLVDVDSTAQAVLAAHERRARKGSSCNCALSCCGLTICIFLACAAGAIVGIIALIRAMDNIVCNDRQLRQMATNPTSGGAATCPLADSPPTLPNSTAPFPPYFSAPVHNTGCGCCSWRHQTCCASACSSKREYTQILSLDQQGTEACSFALGLMNCAVCAPTAGRYAKVIDGRMLLTVCPSRCAALRAACEQVVVTRFNRTVQQLYQNNSAAFCREGLGVRVAPSNNASVCYNGAAPLHPPLRMLLLALLLSALAMGAP